MNTLLGSEFRPGTPSGEQVLSEVDHARLQDLLLKHRRELAAELGELLAGITPTE